MNETDKRVVDMLEFVDRQQREREQEIRERVGDHTEVLTWAANTHGADFAALFPPDLCIDDFALTVSDPAIDEAKARLKLCAACPPYGGGCGSDYEANRGKAPRWDREKGLRLESCSRWPEYIVRKKLTDVGVGARLLGARFDTYNPTTDAQRSAKERCQAYATGFRRGTSASNLILVGQNYGVGKTHLAIAVVADLVARYRLRTAMFVYVPDFLERIRRSYDEPKDRGLMERASSTDLLVLDDLAAERTTDWVREQLNLISNARWSDGLPTIITTNTGPDALAGTLGQRATSRFFSDAIGVEVDGEDRRRIAHSEEKAGHT